MKRVFIGLWVAYLFFLVGVAAQSTVGNFTRLLLGGVAGAGTVDITTGTGTPEAVVTGTVGDVFLRTDGSAGSTMYVKQSGSGNTGWGAAMTGVTEKRWFPAGYCQNATALTLWSLPTTNPAVAACDTGTNTQKGTLDFADGANVLSAETVFHLPTDWTSTIDARLYWYANTTTGLVSWQIATICVADDETGDPAYNTPFTPGTDAVKGVANRYNLLLFTSITTTGCAAGEVMYIKILRDPTNAGDTMAATARLVGIEFTIRRTG